jgi:hypothetical protein
MTMKLSDDQEEVSSNRAHFRHGTADAGPPGMHIGHYDVLHHLFFGGRRRRGLTREPSRAVRAMESGVRA